MAVYLNEEEEARRKEELEEYSRTKQEEIDIERINSREKRMKQDRIFQKILFLTFAAVLIFLVISWWRGV
ncbi:MAG: hypothetical protein IK071_00360 [Lachnospiraceae bacterium]|nr:hypothetical protein [Lachnospiraceae bacterium]